MNQAPIIWHDSPQPSVLQDTEPVGRTSETILHATRSRFVWLAAAGVLLSGCAASPTESAPASVGITAETATPSSAALGLAALAPSVSSQANTAPAVPSPVASSAATPEQAASAPFTLPRPEGVDSFTLTIQTHLVEPMTIEMLPKDVPSGTYFEIPEPPGCTWTDPSQAEAGKVSGDVPAGCDWRGTSRYTSKAGFAEFPAGKVSVDGKDVALPVVGLAHTCRTHICDADGVHRVPDGDDNPANDTFTVTPDDTIYASIHDKSGNPVGKVNYNICNVTSAEKYENPAPGEHIAIPNCDDGKQPDLILMTCDKEINPATGEPFRNNNIVIFARAVSAEAAPAQ